VTGHRKSADKPGRLRDSLGVSPTTDQAVFTPQPYPLFLADWSKGDPLVGRIIGWSTEPGRAPQPAVVFEDDGQSCTPILVNMTLGMGAGGPMWIRDSHAEALEAAKAYTPPTTSLTREEGT
jgi:hypothetical protein